MDDDDDPEENYWDELVDDDGHEPWQWNDGVWCCEDHEQTHACP